MEEGNDDNSVSIINDIWDIFTKSTDTANCDAVCTISGCLRPNVKRSRGSTTGMRDHAFRHHKIKAPVKQAQPGKRKIATKCSQNDSFTHLKIQYPLHGILAEMVALEGSTFHSIGNGHQTRKNIEARIKTENISQHLPKSESTIKEYVILYGEKAKSILREKIKKRIESGDKFSIDFDEWTSCATKKYLNISLLCSQNQVWNLGLVRVPGHGDAETIIGHVVKRLQFYGLDLDRDIVSLVTDGASTMQKIMRSVSNEHQLCLAHSIQLAIIDVLYRSPTPPEEPESSELDDSLVDTEVDDCLVEEGLKIKKPRKVLNLKNSKVRSAIEKIRRLGTMFKKSDLNNGVLQEYVNSQFGDPLDPTKPKTEKPMITDCRTRWTSLFNMLSRYWEIRDCLEHTLVDIGRDVVITDEDKFIIYSIIRTLEPVALTVKALCRRDSNLLTARAALKVLFRRLERQPGIFAQTILRQLKIRIHDRLTNNSGILQYLLTGSYKNDYDSYTSVEIEEDVMEERDVLSFDETGIFDDPIFDNNLYPDHLSASQIFEIPFKSDIRDHIIGLIERLCSTVENTEIHFSNSSPESSQDNELTVKKPKNKFQQELDDAILSATRAPSATFSSSNIAKRVQQEMTLLEKSSGQERGYYLQMVYNFLMTIRPTSVESERAFSVAGYLCTKIRNRFIDATLDTLCFLRNLFRDNLLVD